MVVDYHRLNEVTASDEFPLPRMDDILSKFSGMRYFSAFNVNKGFHQIPITKDSDRDKSAFTCHLGQFRYTRMPFGVKNGPAVFQREISRVLTPVLNRCALVYIDDILVFSPDFDTHLKDCAEVLGLITHSGMTLKPKKCHVGFHNIEALGHHISRVGIHTSPDKVAAIRDMAAPTNVRLTRTFLGLAGYYRRFIKDYATIARPLSELTKKDYPFAWGDRQQRAFETLKQCLCE